MKVKLEQIWKVSTLNRGMMNDDDDASVTPPSRVGSWWNSVPQWRAETSLAGQWLPAAGGDGAWEQWLAGRFFKFCFRGMRVFITNVKGTFLGMSESEEASKRRWNSYLHNHIINKKTIFLRDAITYEANFPPLFFCFISNEHGKWLPVDSKQHYVEPPSDNVASTAPRFIEAGLWRNASSKYTWGQWIQVSQMVHPACTTIDLSGECGRRRVNNLRRKDGGMHLQKRF